LREAINVKGKDCITFLEWALPYLGLTWTGYRRVHRQVCKRLGRRLAMLGLGDMADYRGYLGRHPAEWGEVAAACLIPISRFFRDRAVFDRLGSDVLPEIARHVSLEGRNVIRVWSIGCASGEEPYSLSILWQLGPARAFSGLALEILAMDAAPHLIARARNGCYAKGSLREVPEAWIETAFFRKGGLYCVRSAFGQGVSFVDADLESPLPKGPFDLVLCRNVILTYFALQRRKPALRRISSVMSDGGYLVVGRKEHLPASTKEFVPVGDALPIYRLSQRARNDET
jgi:chemotaxis protein methyltransferase CheR